MASILRVSAESRADDVWHLEQVMDRLVPPGGVWDEPALAALWAQVTFGTSDDRSETFDALLHGLEAGDEALHLRGGAWAFDARTTAARATLVGTLLAGAFAIVGDDQSLPLYVLPAVIPLLFDVRSVRLRRDERAVLAKLRRIPGVAGEPLPLSDLYEALPASARNVVSELDFIRYVERFVDAGAADEDRDRRIVISHEGEERWLKISFGPS